MASKGQTFKRYDLAFKQKVLEAYKLGASGTRTIIPTLFY